MPDEHSPHSTRVFRALFAGVLQSARTRALACVLACALLLTGALGGFVPYQQAFAATSAEKQAEADAMVKKLDELQTQLDGVRTQYTDATQAHENALLLMEEARQEGEAAEARITELQERLNARATQMYRNGTVTYLDVLFGAGSFAEFVTSWDMMNRVNNLDAELVQESRDAKAEAEAARITYEEQERIAGEKEKQIAELKSEMEAKAIQMQAEIDRLSAEAAELLAQEQAAAEAARLKAEEDARRAASGASVISPEQLGRVPSFVHPCPGAVISSGFGWRDFDSSYHMGTDFACASGTPIYAAAAGTVIIAGYSSSAGNWVVITHGNGVVTKYMHASALYVSVGQTVSAGETIAAVGSTGYSTGPHLHFQVEIDGQAVNPMIFL
ncbi:MAG: peptidoglycan DD-metalloendopeptidase family protein [Coriobacteriales bacterium]|jgi:murein DD-endopeptidase MepM/ murein hydrolase activator NlpD|nr:peptidoglycan DD-metalloendopeptidase family protein [Coriobacteriales bacterium]